MKHLLTVVARLSSGLAALPSLPHADRNRRFCPNSLPDGRRPAHRAVTTDAAQADAAYPAVLNEYGFAGSETATYTRNDGRTLTLKAAQIQRRHRRLWCVHFLSPAGDEDRADWHQGGLGQPAHPVLPQQPAGGRQLRSRDRDVGSGVARTGCGIARSAQDAADNLPTLPQYLPKQDAVENSAKYILGPQALLASQSPLTAEQVDFSHDPEILMQDYASKSGPLTLTVLQYPTPQIAGERCALEGVDRRIPNSLLARRSGPLVDVVTGSHRQRRGAGAVQLRELRSRSHVERSDLVSKRDNIGNLIVGSLHADRNSAADIAHLRSVLRRHSHSDEAAFPESVFDRPEDVEIIQLHLGKAATRQQVAENKPVRTMTVQNRQISASFPAIPLILVTY